MAPTAFEEFRDQFVAIRLSNLMSDRCVESRKATQTGCILFKRIHSYKGLEGTLQDRHAVERFFMRHRALNDYERHRSVTVVLEAAKEAIDACHLHRESTDAEAS